MYLHDPTHVSFYFSQDIRLSHTVQSIAAGQERERDTPERAGALMAMQLMRRERISTTPLRRFRGGELSRDRERVSKRTYYSTAAQRINGFCDIIETSMTRH